VNMRFFLNPESLIPNYMPFTIINETDSGLFSIPFKQIKEASLGVNYSLNLIFTTSAKIKKLNTIYRDKEYATDILSFPISNIEGEIYISEKETRAEAKKFERTYPDFLTFLFIHGCTHLKGYDHGSIMEDVETKIRKKFGI